MWIGFTVGAGGILVAGLVWWLIFRVAMRDSNSAKNGNEFGPDSQFPNIP
jgi:hypothetical protein